jgi:hypothetical protein
MTREEEQHEELHMHVEEAMLRSLQSVFADAQCQAYALTAVLCGIIHSGALDNAEIDEVMSSLATARMLRGLPDVEGCA